MEAIDVVANHSSVKDRLSACSMKIKSGYFFTNVIEKRKNIALLEKARWIIESDKSVNPLISVITPTFNRSKVLVQRTIPSVLSQTYKNFELLIIGDCCSDDTEKRIKEFNDERIKFINLKQRGKYPKDSHARWMVAGCIPRNKGLELASGKWVAPMDDDDEFSEDHLETLLTYATKNHFEMVYGMVHMEKEPNYWVKRGSYPLSYQNICHMSVLYRSELRFFKYNINAWKYGYEDDWDLWVRMKDAGVKIGFVNSVVGKHYLERTLWGV